MGSPFVRYEGRPYLIVSFELEPSNPPDLASLLEGLLRHHSPQDLLLLRPLSPSEATKLKKATADSEVDTWAQLVVVPEDRLRPRPRGPR